MKKKAECNFMKFVISKVSEDFGKDDKKVQKQFLNKFQISAP